MIDSRFVVDTFDTIDSIINIYNGMTVYVINESATYILKQSIIKLWVKL